MVGLLYIPAMHHALQSPGLESISANCHHALVISHPAEWVAWLFTASIAWRHSWWHSCSQNNHAQWCPAHSFQVRVWEAWGRWQCCQGVNGVMYQKVGYVLE